MSALEASSEGFWDSDIADYLADNFTQKYPEERNKEIKVYKGESPLDPKYQKSSAIAPIQKELDELDESLSELITGIGFNKFSLGTGAVDVTFQVRDGVRYALEDTFTGYAEFQRRKVLEEILNANASATKMTNEFLLISSGLKKPSTGLSDFQDYIDIFDNFFAFADFSSFSGSPSGGIDLLETTKIIIDKEIIRSINNILSSMAAALCIVLFGATMLMRSGNLQGSSSLIEPLLQSIKSILMIFCSYYILHSCFDAGYYISKTLSDHSAELSSLLNAETLNRSWERLANEVGYFPTLILSTANIAAEIFCYIYIAGLLLQIILGFLIAPLWALALSNDRLEGAGIASFLCWLKALLTLNFIPLIYLCFALINQELSNYELDILNISFSIASLLLLPMVSKLLMGESNGFAKSAFWGYELMLNNIDSAYRGLRQILEEQYQLSLNTHAKLASEPKIYLEPSYKITAAHSK